MSLSILTGHCFCVTDPDARGLACSEEASIPTRKHQLPGLAELRMAFLARIHACGSHARLSGPPAPLALPLGPRGGQLTELAAVAQEAR